MASTRIRQEKDPNKKALDNQIQNRNYLAPTGFKFIISRAPKISYFGNQVNLPSLTLDIANQPSYLKNIPRPGTQIDFQDLTLRFLVDENLENYMVIHNWLRGLGYPETVTEHENLITDPETNEKDRRFEFSDGSLHILNSNYRDIAIVEFLGLFPVFLTSLEFEATDTDVNYFTAEVTFKYTLFNMLKPDGRTRL